MAVQEEATFGPRAAVHVEHHLVDARQTAALPIGHPILRITFQQGELPEAEFLQAIRPAPDDPVRLRVNAVGDGEDFSSYGIFQDMFGQDRHAAKELHERRKNLRRHHSDGEVIDLAYGERLAADAEQVVRDVVEPRVGHDVVPGKHDIVGGQGCAVAPMHACPELEGPCLLIRRDGP